MIQNFFKYFAGGFSETITLTSIVIGVVILFIILMMYIPTITKHVLP